MANKKSLCLAMLIVMAATLASANTQGSVFVTGHDSDFHASLGPNPAGAQNIIIDALNFVRNGNTAPILVIQTDLSNLGLGDHTDSLNGLNASGYSAGNTPGNHYVVVNATTFMTTNLSLYSAIFVPSDHGGTLTEADISALDSRSADILSYVNNGGGLAAFAEDGFHTGGNTKPLFGFLPFLATSAPLSEFEGGNTLTSFGTALGLSNSDINGNFSHNIFTSTGGMNIVDRDAGQEILSLDFRGNLGVHGAAPEPGSLVLLGSGLLGIAGAIRRKVNL